MAAPTKTVRLVISLFFLIGFVLGIFTLPSEKKINETDVKGLQTTIAPTVAVYLQTASDSAEKQEATVIKVTDGDTITVSLTGKKEKIRVIGINTPETVDPRKPVQCFGKEASDKAKELLTNQTVWLESDPTQDNRDKYGRLLRFVWFNNGAEDYGAYMIENGYANEYTYDVPYKYQGVYRQKQQEASAAKRGLWGDVCASHS